MTDGGLKSTPGGPEDDDPPIPEPDEYGDVDTGMNNAADDPGPVMRDGRVAFSEDDLAHRFSIAHVGLKFVATWSKWLQWTGVKWEIDTTVQIFDLARAVCRKAAAECNKPQSRKVASAATVYAVERLARADRRHATTPEQWDADDDLFNTNLGEDQ